MFLVLVLPPRPPLPPVALLLLLLLAPRPLPPRPRPFPVILLGFACQLRQDNVGEPPVPGGRLFKHTYNFKSELFQLILLDDYLVEVSLGWEFHRDDTDRPKYCISVRYSTVSQIQYRISS